MNKAYQWTRRHKKKDKNVHRSHTNFTFLLPISHKFHFSFCTTCPLVCLLLHVHVTSNKKRYKWAPISHKCHFSFTNLTQISLFYLYNVFTGVPCSLTLCLILCLRYSTPTPNILITLEPRVKNFRRKIPKIVKKNSRTNDTTLKSLGWPWNPWECFRYSTPTPSGFFRIAWF